MNALWWQLKDEYSRCKWSEQCHIAASERWFIKYGAYLFGSVCILAIAQYDLTRLLLPCYEIVGRIVYCVSLILTILSWATDWQYSARLHKDAADCYYNIGLSYIELLLKIKFSNIDKEQVIIEHIRLNAEMNRISSKYPKTNKRDYDTAKKSIEKGAITFGTYTCSETQQCAKDELDIWFSPELKGDLQDVHSYKD